MLEIWVQVHILRNSLNNCVQITDFNIVFNWTTLLRAPPQIRPAEWCTRFQLSGTLFQGQLIWEAASWVLYLIAIRPPLPTRDSLPQVILYCWWRSIQIRQSMNHPNNPLTVNFSHQGRNRSKILHLGKRWENMPCMKRKVTKKAIEEIIYLLEPIWPFSFNNTKQWFRRLA